MRLWKASRRGRCSRTRAPRTSPPVCLKTSWHWASSVKPRSESSFTWRGSQEKNDIIIWEFCPSNNPVCNHPLTHFWSWYFFIFSLVSPSVATDGIRIRSKHFHFFHSTHCGCCGLWFYNSSSLVCFNCSQHCRELWQWSPKGIFSESCWHARSLAIYSSASNVRKVWTSSKDRRVHLFTAIKARNKQKKEEQRKWLQQTASCLKMTGRGSHCSVCSVFGCGWSSCNNAVTILGTNQCLQSIYVTLWYQKVPGCFFFLFGTRKRQVQNMQHQLPDTTYFLSVEIRWIS